MPPSTSSPLSSTIRGATRCEQSSMSTLNTHGSRCRMVGSRLYDLQKGGGTLCLWLKVKAIVSNQQTVPLQSLVSLHERFEADRWRNKMAQGPIKTSAEHSVLVHEAAPIHKPTAEVQTHNPSSDAYNLAQVRRRGWDWKSAETQVEMCS